MISSRKRAAAVLSATAIGAGALVLGGSPAQASSDARPAVSSETVSSETVSASTLSVGARKPNFSLIPKVRTNKKGVAKKGLDFGSVTRITEKHGVMKIYFDRAEFYTGRAAAAHNGGEMPPNSYKIVDNSSKVRVFTVSKKATFTGEDVLLDDSSEGVKRTRISREQFLTNFINAPGSVKVWVRHTNGDKGTITALGEQYTP